MDICEQAEAFRLLLLMGVVAKSDVIEWADEVIVTRDDLPNWLLDVSLAANEDDQAVASKLDDLPCEGNRMLAAYAAIDRFAEAFSAGTIRAETATRMLAAWASSAKVSHADWQAAVLPGWVAAGLDAGHMLEEDVAEA